MADKRVMRVLEKCFDAEIKGHLPAQFRHGQFRVNGIGVSRAVALAERDGLIEQVDRRMSFNDGLPPMTIRGFELTQLGHLAYCEWAAGAAESPAEPDA